MSNLRFINNKILQRYIAIFTVVMIIPLSIGGVAMGITIQKTKRQAVENSYLSLQNLATGLENEFVAVQQYAMNLVTDRQLSEFSYDVADVQKRIELMELVSKIKADNSIKLVNSMYVYMGSENMVIANNAKYDMRAFYETVISKSGETWENWSERMMQRYYNHFNYGENVMFYDGEAVKSVVEYIQSYPIGRNIKGNIVILIDADKITQYYSAVYSDKKALFVLDNDDAVIYSAGNVDKYALKQEYISMEDNHSTGLFSSITAYKLEKGNFKFISIEDNAAINDGLSGLLLADIILIILLLITGALLIIFAAYKISEPMVELKAIINRFSDSKEDNGLDMKDINKRLLSVFESKKDAERIIEEQTVSVKNSLLKRIISGNLDNIENDLSKFGIYFNEECFAVIVVDIHSQKLDSKTMLLAKYAVRKMLISSFEKFCHMESIDDEWGRLIAILNFNSDENAQTKIMEALFSLEDFVQMEFLTEADINMGRIYSGISNVYRSYREAIECTEYRVYSGTSRVLAYDKLRNKTTVYLYSQEQENEFIRSVIMGNEKAALSCMNKMIAAHQNGSITVVQCFFFNLIGTMLKILNMGNIEMAEGIDRQVRFENLFKCKSIIELRKESETIVREICENINSRSCNKKQNLKKALLEYVEVHYCDNSMSLEKIAREFDLNFNYISHFFKDEIGENFSDLITKRRIEKAKELLRESEMTLYEIAIKVGYANSAVLIRNFKKITGITPGKFKENL